MIVNVVDAVVVILAGFGQIRSLKLYKVENSLSTRVSALLRVIRLGVSVRVSVRVRVSVSVSVE